MQTAVIAPPAGRPRILYLTIALLSVAGALVSSVSLYHHFSKSKTSFCDIGQTFNCDLVNRSQYSVFHGVPVALLGILGYLAILSLATVYREKAETPFILAGTALFGCGFALYLTYVEAFVLHAWCLLCLSSLGLMVAITTLAQAGAIRASRR